MAHQLLLSLARDFHEQRAYVSDITRHEFPKIGDASSKVRDLLSIKCALYRGDIQLDHLQAMQQSWRMSGLSDCGNDPPRLFLQRHTLLLKLLSCCGMLRDVMLDFFQPLL
ncbi:MAG TPA: hypothetical protein VIX19_16155 [Terriglobales bacterium]